MFCTSLDGSTSQKKAFQTDSLEETGCICSKVPGRSQTLDNLHIPHHGQTTEVDVLMLHEMGIWVFESKHYSGWIFGRADQRQWTQSLNSRTKEHFYNPILQNRTHVNALVDYLGLPRDSFHPYVVFSEKCELKSVPDSCDEFVILRRNHLLRELRKDLTARDVIFDEARMASIAEGLAAATRPTSSPSGASPTSRPSRRAMSARSVVESWSSARASTASSSAAATIQGASSRGRWSRRHLG